MNSIFSSSEEYKKYFNEGLIKLSLDQSIGTFILAMANATFSKEIYTVTRESLRNNFLQLEKKYVDSFSHGKKVKEVDEDLLVFLKMICVGFENLQTTAFRYEADWELQFNHVRGFRPDRVSQQQFDSLLLAYSAAGFNFNKPFMDKERLWEGDFQNSQLSLYYNKYPFAHYHTLLVPERDKQHPQFLKLPQHNLIWDFVAATSENINGIGVGYNSRGAFSSVNHLHFQMFIREKELPVTDNNWQHNGGTTEYPVYCEVFTTAKESSHYIEKLHKNNTAYNLLYMPGRIYCFPRKMQGQYQHAEWTPGFSWYEFSGGILTSNKDSYENLTALDVEAEFKLANLNTV